MLEIIKGLTSEIIIVSLTAVSIFLFNNYFHPFILGVFLRTPDLSGVWNGYDIDEQGSDKQTSRMTIRQIGSRVNATVVLRSGNGTEREFNYKGTISSGQVLMIWKEKQSNGYNMGTMTLLLGGNLRVLTGKTTFNHHDLGRIVSKEKIYKKVSN